MTRFELHRPMMLSQLKLKTTDGKIRLNSADLVRLRARPEAVGEGQSGLMLHVLSCYGNSHSKDRRGAFSVTLIVGQTES